MAFPCSEAGFSTDQHNFTAWCSVCHPGSSTNKQTQSSTFGVQLSPALIRAQLQCHCETDSCKFVNWQQQNSSLGTRRTYFSCLLCNGHCPGDAAKSVHQAHFEGTFARPDPTLQQPPWHFFDASAHPPGFCYAQQSTSYNMKPAC